MSRAKNALDMRRNTEAMGQEGAMDLEYSGNSD